MALTEPYVPHSLMTSHLLGNNCRDRVRDAPISPFPLTPLAIIAVVSHVRGKKGRRKQQNRRNVGTSSLNIFSRSGLNARLRLTANLAIISTQ